MFQSASVGLACVRLRQAAVIGFGTAFSHLARRDYAAQGESSHLAGGGWRRCLLRLTRARELNGNQCFEHDGTEIRTAIDCGNGMAKVTKVTTVFMFGILPTPRPGRAWSHWVSEIRWMSRTQCRCPVPRPTLQFDV